MSPVTQSVDSALPHEAVLKSHYKKNYSCYRELTDGFMFSRNVSYKNMLLCQTCRRKAFVRFVLLIMLVSMFYCLKSILLRVINVLLWSRFSSRMPRDSQCILGLYFLSDGLDILEEFLSDIL